MALVIAFATVAAVAVLLAVLARMEESLLNDPQVRDASRPVDDRLSRRIRGDGALADTRPRA